MARFLDPKIIEKPKNIDSKRHHKIDQCLNRSLIDFCSVLDAKLVPCWPPFSAQDRPRGLQDGSKTVQDSSQDALDRPSRPKTPPNLPRSLPDLDFWSICCWFLVDFDWFLVDVYWFFDRSVVDVWSIFNRFWSIVFASFLRCFMDLLLCYFVLGAVAGSQLCCAVDRYRYRHIYRYS